MFICIVTFVRKWHCVSHNATLSYPVALPCQLFSVVALIKVLKPFSSEKGFWPPEALERSDKIKIQHKQPPRAFFGLIPKNAGEKFSQRKLVAEACSVRQKEALFTDKPALFAKEFPENPYCKSYQNTMFPLNSNFLKKIAKSA